MGPSSSKSRSSSRHVLRLLISASFRRTVEADRVTSVSSSNDSQYPEGM